MSEIVTYDVGSLPVHELDLPYTQIEGSMKLNIQFRNRILDAFIDKVKAGIIIPNYPQFRDMNNMFLEMFSGIEKIGAKYYMMEKLNLQYKIIPEVKILREAKDRLYELLGDKIRLKVCVTSPYTLSFSFGHRDINLLLMLSHAIAEIVRSTIFRDKKFEVSILALDEPVLGFADDTLIEFKSEGREILVKGLNNILHYARVKGVETCLHLHNTADPLFWEIDNLMIIESHVDDYLYTSKYAREMLEKKDKFLKASICITDYDKLILDKIKGTVNKEDIHQELANKWLLIKRGEEDPLKYLETVETMCKRLKNIILTIGVDRVRYAGPECGLKGFPNYKTAIECLKRVVKAVERIN